jgi:hypothetical protein
MYCPLGSELQANEENASGEICGLFHHLRGRSDEDVQRVEDGQPNNNMRIEYLQEGPG